MRLPWLFFVIPNPSRDSNKRSRRREEADSCPHQIYKLLHLTYIASDYHYSEEAFFRFDADTAGLQRLGGHFGSVPNHVWRSRCRTIRSRQARNRAELYPLREKRRLYQYVSAPVSSRFCRPGWRIFCCESGGHKRVFS